MTALPPVTLLRRLLRYDPTTGAITWRVSPADSIRPGALAGRTDRYGYSITIGGVAYMRSNIAWALHHGHEPSHEVTHRDGDRRNNRASNLMDAPRRLRGVSYYARRKRWIARVVHGGVAYYAGAHETEGGATHAVMMLRGRLANE